MKTLKQKIVEILNRAIPPQVLRTPIYHWESMVDLIIKEVEEDAGILRIFPIYKVNGNGKVERVKSKAEQEVLDEIKEYRVPMRKDPNWRFSLIPDGEKLNLKINSWQEKLND